MNPSANQQDQFSIPSGYTVPDKNEYQYPISLPQQRPEVEVSKASQPTTTWFWFWKPSEICLLEVTTVTFQWSYNYQSTTMIPQTAGLRTEDSNECLGSSLSSVSTPSWARASTSIPSTSHNKHQMLKSVKCLNLSPAMSNIRDLPLRSQACRNSWVHLATKSTSRSWQLSLQTILKLK